MRVRVIATPPGEAPEHIRQAWVGLELPLAAGHETAQRFRTVGVLSGPKTILGRLLSAFTARPSEPGFLVNAPLAFAELEAHAPEAATWWREHTPQFFAPGKCLVFAARCCQVVDAAEHSHAWGSEAE